MTDIHNFQKRFQRATRKLQDCSLISKENKDLIFKFIEYKQAQGTSLARCVKYMDTIRGFALGFYEKSHYQKDREKMPKNPITKNFGTLTKNDIQHEMARLEGSNLKESAKRDYKVLVRLFIGWVFHEKMGSQEPYDPKEHGYPVIFKSVHIKQPEETIKSSDLFTDVDKQKMISVTKNFRDRALIALLDEAGMRPGELLNLKVGNVVISEQCGELSLDGKTGIRPTFIIRNLSYLVQWLDAYERRDCPDAPLWPDLEKPEKSLSYDAFRQMVKRTAQRAGINKRAFPYVFRHSSATSDCQELTEPIMRKLYGWSKKSQTPSRYEHLSEKDAKTAKLRQAGIIESGPEVKIRLCPRCKTPNPAASSMCYKCGSVISLKLAIEQRDSLASDVKKLKEDFNNLKREIFARQHDLLSATNEEIDIAMETEEKDLNLLRKAGLTVKIEKDGKFTRSSPK